MSAIDVSADALEIARRNASINDVSIDFECCDILTEPLKGRFDIIVSNPPYIPDDESARMSSNTLKFEPGLALFTGGSDALVFYKRIGELALDHLDVNGSLFFELNEFRSEEIRELTASLGFETEVRSDMQGKPRMLRAFKT